MKRRSSVQKKPSRKQTFHMTDDRGAGFGDKQIVRLRLMSEARLSKLNFTGHQFQRGHIIQRSPDQQVIDFSVCHILSQSMENAQFIQTMVIIYFSYKICRKLTINRLKQPRCDSFYFTVLNSKFLCEKEQTKTQNTSNNHSRDKTVRAKF